MRRLTLLLLLTALLAMPAVADYIELDDGEFHIINDNRYENDDISIDYNLNYIPDKPTTTLTLQSLGIIGGNISGHHNSAIFINGGSVGGGIQTLQNSSLEINSGTIGGNLHARDEGVISIKGGTFDGYMDAWHGGTIYLYGTNFMVDGQSLSFGDNLRDFGVIGDESNDYLTGIITGTLEYGTEIDNEFRIVATLDGSDIFIVPEPATLSLLLIGAGCLFRSNA